MSEAVPKLYLASQSPRRRQLLDNAGLKFEIVEPHAAEAHPSAENVDAVTMANSLAKATSILAQLGAEDAIVIGADTLVVLGKEVLGKPKDEKDARAMVKRLSGATHFVVTGLTLLSKTYGLRQSAVRSHVKFRELSDEEIANYCKTKEPYDKAGAYALQGMAAIFVDEIHGSYPNVVGLPVETLLVELEALTGIPLYRWFL